MKKLFYRLYIIYMIVSLLAPAYQTLAQGAATCSLTGASWQSGVSNLIVNQDVSFTVSGNNCANTNVNVWFCGRGGTTWYFVKSVTMRFTSATSVTGNLIFTDGDFAGRTIQNGPQTVGFVASVNPIVSCSTTPAGGVTSQHITVSTASDNPGATISNFDVQPRALTATNRAVRIVFNVSVNPVDFRRVCGGNANTLHWSVYADGALVDWLSGQQTIPPSPGTTQTYDFGTPSATVQFFTGTSRALYGLLECPDGSNIARSAGVTITQPGAPGGGGDMGRDLILDFEIPNPLGSNRSILDVINIIATWIFNLAIPIVVIMIIYAGVRFVLARGNPGEIQKAKDILRYALLGLVIVLIGKGFVTLIQSFATLGAP